MGQASTIGLDIAKRVFQAHGADATGRVVFRKRLVRAKVLEFFAGQPPYLVALEACGGRATMPRSPVRPWQPNSNKIASGKPGAVQSGYVGTLKGVGRVYQQSVIDTHAKVAFAKLYDR